MPLLECAGLLCVRLLPWLPSKRQWALRPRPSAPSDFRGRCFAITLAGLTRFLLARMEPVHALLFVGMAAAMMLSHLLVRPHVLVWPLFALWVGVQVNASESHRSPPWWLLIVMALWANLH